jgi:hypothetical protein
MDLMNHEFFFPQRSSSDMKRNIVALEAKVVPRLPIKIAVHFPSHLLASCTVTEGATICLKFITQNWNF